MSQIVPFHKGPPFTPTEGMSIRAISRVTDVHKTTILSLLKTVGTRCAMLLDTRLRNLRPRYIQADEAWTFVQKKQKRLTLADPVLSVATSTSGWRSTARQS